jgi:hypothetical protein
VSEKNYGILLIYVYSLLSHRIGTFRKFIAKSVQVLLSGMNSREVAAPHRYRLGLEATFHTYAVVNLHSCRIWGREYPQALTEHVRHKPKVNVRCKVTSDRIVWTLFLPWVDHYDCSPTDTR